MRRYYTESVGSLLKKMKKDMKILQMQDTQDELTRVWSTLSDPTLQRLNTTFRITPDGRLEIIASSAVAFNYLRRQRNLIERELADFMKSNAITEISITQQ